MDLQEEQFRTDRGISRINEGLVKVSSCNNIESIRDDP